MRYATSCAASSKRYAFSTIIMYVLQCPDDIDVHLLFCFDLDLLFPRSCLALIEFVYPHWWVPFCVLCPEKAMPFWQMIMYVLQCPHAIHVHLYCFDLHKFNLFLLHLRAATCPTSNCGRGTSLLRQELVLFHYFYLYFLNMTHIFTAIMIHCRLPMAEQVGCGIPCLLWSLGVREVVGSRPGRGNSRESFSSNQETGKVLSPEMPFYSKF